MTSAGQAATSRRGFIKASALAAGGLMVTLYLDPPAAASPQGGPPPPAHSYPPDAFVRILPDGKIVITVNRLEVGQGAQTALPMILAEELDADWTQVVGQLAPAGELYKDPVIGVQMIGGSCSILDSFQQYRELGARTRAMLIGTAADRWGVQADECRTDKSVVYGPGNRSARYAELAEGAARRPVPAVVQLKSASEFRLIGTPVRRIDSRAKCDGSQQFGLDLNLPDMLTALACRGRSAGDLRNPVGSRKCRRGGGGRFLGRQASSRSTGCRLGRLRCRASGQRAIVRHIPRVGGNARQGCRQRGGCAGDRSNPSPRSHSRRVRVSVPRPCGDGAAQHHGPERQGSSGSMGSVANPNLGASRACRRIGPQA